MALYEKRLHKGLFQLDDLQKNLHKNDQSEQDNLLVKLSQWAKITQDDLLERLKEVSPVRPDMQMCADYSRRSNSRH